MPKNSYDKAKISRTALCPYYASHTSTYIICEGKRVTQQEYSVKADCCGQFWNCPQYKYLTFCYTHEKE